MSPVVGLPVGVLLGCEVGGKEGTDLPPVTVVGALVGTLVG